MGSGRAGALRDSLAVRRSIATRLERDPAFAFMAMRRYEGSCALTGIRVPDMLEAAHVIPVASGGSTTKATPFCCTRLCIVDVGLTHPAPHRLLRHREIVSHFSHRDERPARHPA